MAPVTLRRSCSGAGAKSTYAGTPGGITLKLVVLLGAALVLSGCAVTEATVPVVYTPVAVTNDRNLASVRVTVTATDARVTNRARIGAKVNGYGMEMGAIRTSDDVAEDVKQALTTELKDRGYTLQPGGSQVDVAVTAFYNQYKVGVFAGRAEGSASMTVKVTSASGSQLYTRDVEGVSHNTVELANGPNAAKAIAAALSDAMTTLFADPEFTRALSSGQAAGSAPAA